MINSIILRLAAVLLVLTVLVIAGYLIYYRREINRRLENLTTDKRRLWSPLRVSLTAVIGALALFAVTCLLLSAHEPAAVSEPSAAASHARILSQEEMAEGYLSRFSMEENAGYEKKVQVLDNVKYTAFVSTEPADVLHPAFLIYAEYLGDAASCYRDVSVSFLNEQGQETAGVFSSGSERGKPVVCIVGNSLAGGSVACIVDFYQEERQEFQVEELQKKHTPLVLQMPIG